ncbi:phosphoenolpyruvate carboxylase, partial [Pseudomonas aeruginosa]|uniref:phosphoenolpyruvate carboxylase n=1 Tax=Pseudomonas aeruginosa TaxID=287 RepID=UPI001C7D1175
REFNEQLKESIDYNLPVEAAPIRFTSWMGGDRDGNPNVTAEITRHALLLSRWKAADLFLNDIQVLVSELSMTECTPELRQLAGGDEVAEPYREIAKQLRTRLQITRDYLEQRIKDKQSLPPAGLLIDNADLWDPLYACYQSLLKCGMSIIANGQLLDTLRRIRCFGLQLVKLDIRQESTNHTEALSELTQYLELGDYASWSEEEKQTF